MRRLGGISAFLLCIVSAMLFGKGVSAQSTDCAAVKNGSFRLKHPGMTVLITRKGNIQTEEVLETGIKVSLEVTWLDDCTYELRKPKLLKGDPATAMPADVVITSEIVEVTNKFYRVRSRNNKTDQVFDFEIEIP